MYQVPLSQLPNQSVSFNVDGAYWQIHLYQAVKTMCADVYCNGNAVIQGVRCYGGIPLMPFEYMHLPDYGNFVFDVDADWTLFDGQCNLYYLDSDEWSSYKSLMLL